MNLSSKQFAEQETFSANLSAECAVLHLVNEHIDKK